MRDSTNQEANLRRSRVSRGEVYICDFGTTCGSEQGGMRYALIIQNNDGNCHSPTTIVIPCTTKVKRQLPVHHNFTFSSDNMIDYDKKRVGTKVNTLMAEQIRVVDKVRLKKYIGKMTPEFMNEVQEIIDISLGLRR